MRSGLLRHGMNWWPPFRGAGIRVRRIAHDYREIDVELSLRWHNRNYVGTHFGGSLYAMTDPFYMLMLLHILGRDYVVSHKAGAIDYVAPATGTVRAQFRIDEEALAEIRARTAGGEKYLPEFEVDVRDAQGKVVARVKHTLYVRLRSS